MNKMLTFILGLFAFIGILLLIGACSTFVFSRHPDYNAVGILTIMGAIFFLIGFIPLMISRYKQRLKMQLLKSGRLVEAKLVEVTYNTSLEVNGRSPFVIRCQWTDPIAPEALYLFTSENIWFNPTDFIKKETISVYIDPNNPKRYYVDVRFLPREV